MNATQPRTTDRRVVALAGLLGVGALALTGCGPAASNPTTVATPAAAPTTTAASPATTRTATPTTQATTPKATTAPATSTSPASPSAAPATPSAQAARACLTDAGLCFTPPAGMDVADVSERSGSTLTTNALVFGTKEAGNVAKVYAVIQGAGGVGGGCTPNTLGTATIVKSVETKATAHGPQGTQVPVYAVQIVQPHPSGAGFAARTYLTADPDAARPGDVDACSLLSSEFFRLNEGSPIITSYAGMVEQAKDLPGVSRDEAVKALATPMHAQALELFSTAQRA